MHARAWGICFLENNVLFFLPFPYRGELGQLSPRRQFTLLFFHFSLLLPFSTRFLCLSYAFIQTILAVVFLVFCKLLVSLSQIVSMISSRLSFSPYIQPISPGSYTFANYLLYTLYMQALLPIYSLWSFNLVLSTLFTPANIRIQLFSPIPVYCIDAVRAELYVSKLPLYIISMHVLLAILPCALYERS